jgi:hypothetical protein
MSADSPPCLLLDVADATAARQAQRFLLKVGHNVADAHGELSAWIGGDVDAAGRAVELVEEVVTALEAV